MCGQLTDTAVEHHHNHLHTHKQTAVEELIRATETKVQTFVEASPSPEAILASSPVYSDWTLVRVMKAHTPLMTGSTSCTVGETDLKELRSTMTVMRHTVHYCGMVVCTCASILRCLRLVSGLKDCGSVTVASGTEGGKGGRKGEGERREEEGG